MERLCDVEIIVIFIQLIAFCVSWLLIQLSHPSLVMQVCLGDTVIIDYDDTLWPVQDQAFN